ncbi:hypothetical protein [Wenzhouxiangella marina]|uniref:Uncharacterized protein n=1 Tax=Wenzhouxiangella marina TaxID=1579979 RepID=A0A0K0XYV6_9GAMM|nr:hypothetical protein [Wenzhouxiangella marina]AKS42806.1 hypothetical protein WM2015_2444 [Wenzhouxiangella marina]MBB6087516.1 small-conductance mechanosensitive channel [Wenzhouxiangella marina]
MDFKIGQVLGLMAKTMPFLVFRFLIYFAITLTYILITGVGAGVGWGIGRIATEDPAGFSMWGGIIGFGLVSAVAYFLREYLLYMVKAGHIAVLVELLEGKELPQGRGQIDHAQKIVRERFTESSVLFGVDQLIKAVLKTFNRVFFTITNFIPIPGLQGIAKFVNTVINLSLTYLDEVILAYNIKTGSTNPWESSRTALVLYAQNYKTFLKNAFFLAFVIWGLTFLVFLLVLGPVLAIVSLLPAVAGPLTLIIAVVLAWGIKQAVIEPIGMTALMQVFFKVTEGQQANPEWEGKLDGMSKKFGELKSKASDWDRSHGSTSKPSDEPPQGGAPAQG